MWKQLSKCKTASIIEQTPWRCYLQPLLEILLGSSIIEGLTIAHGDIAELLVDLAIREQADIGWDRLLLGLGSISWKTLQETIDLSNPKAPKRNATDWMNSATHSLIKFSLQCWKARNSAIHGATKQEQHRIALQQAQDKIKAIYENPPKMASHFHSIFDIPLEHCLKMSLQAAEHWLSLISHQVKITQHKPMKTHFRAMRCVARSQAKERQLPETPRKAHRRAVQAAVKAMRDKLYQKRHPVATTSSIKRRSRLISKMSTQQKISLEPYQRCSCPEQSLSLRHHPP